MAIKTIKFQQFWYHAEQPGPGDTTILVEVIAKRGDEVDITDEYDLQRGEAEGAFMTDDEKSAYEKEGTPYDPTSPEELAAAAAAQREAIGFDWSNASPDDMADYMEENSMKANDVVEVAQAHPDRINEILEAENILTGDSPRKAVVAGLKKVAAASAE